MESEKQSGDPLVESLSHLALRYMDEKFDVVHERCPRCKVDMEDSMSSIEVPTEKGKKKVGVSIASCPKCGFLGDVDQI